MGIILELILQGRVIAPINSDCWDEAKSDWKESLKYGVGYIDVVGSGHTRGKLVMKIGE